MYAEPRCFMASAEVPGAGLPHDRHARMAARRAFVELKQVFVAAVEPLPGAPRDVACIAWLE